MAPSGSDRTPRLSRWPELTEQPLVGGPMSGTCASFPEEPRADHQLLVHLEGTWHAYRVARSDAVPAEPRPLEYAGEVAELPRLVGGA